METRFEKMANAYHAGRKYGVDKLSDSFHKKLGYYFAPGYLAGQGSELMASRPNEFCKGRWEDPWQLPEEMLPERWEQLKNSERLVEIWGFKKPKSQKKAGEVMRDVIALCKKDPLAMAYARDLFDFGYAFRCLLDIEKCEPDKDALDRVIDYLGACI